MIQKQKFYHVSSLIVFVASIVFFYLLGGGTEVVAEVEEQDGLNTDIPEIGSHLRIGKGKLDNVAIAEEFDKSQKRKSSMANNSFDWFYNDTIAGKTPSSTLQESKEDQFMKMLEESDKIVAEISLSGEEKKETSYRNNTTYTGNNTNASSAPSQTTAEQRRAEFERKRDARLKRIQQQQDSILAAGTKKDETNKQKKEEEKIDKAEVETKKKQSGFYSIEGESKAKSNNIRAVVHGEHKNLQKGSVVKLRILDNVIIGEHKIPKNTFVYAKLSFSSGRAQLTIDNINMDHYIIPFRGIIYDKDGFQGIYVPDNIVDDTKREIGGNVIKDINLNGIPGGGLVSSAVNSIKNAASGSVKEEKISISTNYLVTIKQDTK